MPSCSPLGSRLGPGTNHKGCAVLLGLNCLAPDQQRLQHPCPGSRECGAVLTLPLANCPSQVPLHLLEGNLDDIIEILQAEVGGALRPGPCAGVTGWLQGRQCSCGRLLPAPTPL